MAILYISNPTQYLNLRTTLLTINKHYIIFKKYIYSIFWNIMIAFTFDRFNVSLLNYRINFS